MKVEAPIAPMESEAASPEATNASARAPLGICALITLSIVLAYWTKLPSFALKSNGLLKVISILS